MFFEFSQKERLRAMWVVTTHWQAVALRLAEIAVKIASRRGEYFMSAFTEASNSKGNFWRSHKKMIRTRCAINQSL
jgi:hypothetical protein